jgi:hypothetical protein
MLTGREADFGETLTSMTKNAASSNSSKPCPRQQHNTDAGINNAATTTPIHTHDAEDDDDNDNNAFDANATAEAVNSNATAVFTMQVLATSIILTGLADLGDDASEELTEAFLDLTEAYECVLYCISIYRRESVVDDSSYREPDGSCECSQCRHHFLFPPSLRLDCPTRHAAVARTSLPIVWKTLLLSFSPIIRDWESTNEWRGRLVATFNGKITRCSTCKNNVNANRIDWPPEQEEEEEHATWYLLIASLLRRPFM